MLIRYTCSATRLDSAERLSLCLYLCFFPPRFARQVRSGAQQNVAVQCSCGEVCAGECVDVCLRVCRDIQPGTELLLYGDTVGKSPTTEEHDAQDATAGHAGDGCGRTDSALGINTYDHFYLRYSLSL